MLSSDHIVSEAEVQDLAGREVGIVVVPDREIALADRGQGTGDDHVQMIEDGKRKAQGLQSGKLIRHF